MTDNIFLCEYFVWVMMFDGTISEFYQDTTNLYCRYVSTYSNKGIFNKQLKNVIANKSY